MRRSTCASTIAPTAATISSAEVSSKANRYLVNSSWAMPSTLPPALASRPGRPPAMSVERPGEPGDDQAGEAEAEHDRGDPLPAQRLDQRVRGVPADQHQHEQEQDHDRAGVDDDLHRAEERRLLDHVESPGTSS